MADTGSLIYRTDGVSPLGLVDKSGERTIPGFTPESSYVYNQNGSDEWYGALLESHPDYTGASSRYQYESKKNKSNLSTSDRFDQSKSYPNFKDDLPDDYQYFSTRDYYVLFGDTSTDYFRHGLHIIDNKTPLRSDKNTREAWDGYESGTPLRLSMFDNTPYENNDPVLFGFEIIIDAVSSPLLNGSVEDFIEQFSGISEIGARKYVLSDFKNQFIKFFKTKGTVFIDQDANGQVKTSIPNSTYPNAVPNSTIFESGRKAYMSYYLKKVGGLELLFESNSADKKKYLVDYRKDLLKLTFTEDVSLSIGTLAHLYKLLYWSKANGKCLIPDNLLRFNCDIIISEHRNFNRVRKAIDTGNLEVIKDNVSRHVYSLKECQFWFDTPPHDGEIDLSAPKEFDQYTISMDYKYVTNKFERWVPDFSRFGKYVGYNNAALWKIGNPGSRDNTDFAPGTINDTSVPRFFTAGGNPFNQNGVTSPIVLQQLVFLANTTESIGGETETDMNSYPNSVNNDNIATLQQSNNTSNVRSAKSKNTLDQLKHNSNFAQISSLTKIEQSDANNKNNVREKLLTDSLNKIKSMDTKGVSGNPFFDVRGSLQDFSGGAIDGLLGSTVGKNNIQEKLLSNTLDKVKDMNVSGIGKNNIQADLLSNSLDKIKDSAGGMKNDIQADLLSNSLDKIKKANIKGKGGNSFFDVRGFL